MLTMSDRPIEEVMSSFAKFGVQAAYIVPTATGMQKSIMDAHLTLREYLKLKSIHDYQAQCQGQQNKVLIDAHFVTPQGSRPTRVSLYRPETKLGDPRIWFHGLSEYADAGNLLAVLVYQDDLYIINCSNLSLVPREGTFHPEILRLLGKVVDEENIVAIELLDMLRAIGSQGWVPSMRSGPTGVGFTLETLLGISANSSRQPDFKGIEIKSGRMTRGKKASRITLFSKTPNWSESSVRNGLELLDAYGYRNKDDNRLQLYCSLNNIKNALGHYLVVDDASSNLYSMHYSHDQSSATSVLQWGLQDLQRSLLAKHHETFWVKAEVRSDAIGRENFLYTEVEHTKGPMVLNFVELLRKGCVELDYVIHEEMNSRGQRKSRDHGYLFKMWEKHLGGLFPTARRYGLLPN